MAQEQSLSTTQCGQCGGEIEISQQEPIDMNGVSTMRRTWKCLACGSKQETVDVPFAVACDLWEYDA